MTMIRDPYAEGEAAAREERTPGDNPFAAGTGQAWTWLNGWKRAMADEMRPRAPDPILTVSVSPSCMWQGPASEMHVARAF